MNDRYFPKNDTEENFMKRRNNFHGLSFVALTDKSQENDFTNLNEATYIPSNDTYDVTHYSNGPFYVILKHLENTFNFTTKLYKRKTGGWGMPTILNNGTVEISDGMVKDVMMGSADMIMATVSVLYNR